MAVNLSPVGGAAAQFFTNSGAVLTGGKLYTYAAGTTTPLATYTTNAGNVARTNPIVLDSAGRVPDGGEIWITNGSSYKFVLKDNTDVLIATYDNVTGIGDTSALLVYEAAVAASSGSSLVGFIQSGTGAVATTVQAKLRQTVSVMDFGAVGNGVANDTTAINNAIAYVKSLPLGGAVYFPPGTYATGEINATLCGSSFNQTVKLFGAGRFMTKIIPNGIYPVILNMMGSNDMQISDLTIDSSAYTSQCAIFLARTTVSTNCNNNKFSNVFTTGSYAVASVVSNGSESSNWFNCRFENSYATAGYRCFWTGGGAGVKALQNVITINGGTVLDTNNPNTDNKMFGVEFYAPYASAAPVRFSTSAEYQFYGCTIVAGTSNNCRLVTYGDPTGGRFNGPIGWYGCHFEVFGTGNTVHYLNAPGAGCIFDGISSYSGYYVLSNNTSVIDFDRTNIAELPTLSSSTWTTPTTAPNSTGTNAYVYILSASSFAFKPNPSDGNLYLTGYSELSTVDVTNYYGGATRFLTCYHTTVAAAVPTTGTFTVGETIQRETPVVGQPTGWKCTVSGTLGTLNASATTGGITINTNILVVNSATGLAEGQRINIAGAAGGPFYIRKLSGTTAYLDSNAGATVIAAAVSFSNATLVALANL